MANNSPRTRKATTATTINATISAGRAGALLMAIRAAKIDAATLATVATNTGGTLTLSQDAARKVIDSGMQGLALIPGNYRGAARKGIAAIEESFLAATGDRDGAIYAGLKARKGDAAQEYRTAHLTTITKVEGEHAAAREAAKLERREARKAEREAAKAATVETPKVETTKATTKARTVATKGGKGGKATTGTKATTKATTGTKATTKATTKRTKGAPATATA